MTQQKQAGGLRWKLKRGDVVRIGGVTVQVDSNTSVVIRNAVDPTQLVDVPIEFPKRNQRPVGRSH